MPDQGNMLFIRPKNCHDCGNGYYGLLHVVEYAQNKGIWNITDLSGEQAEKNNVFNAISTNDHYSVMGMGHGASCRYTGDSETDIFTCEDCSILNGRIVYLLSCLTGISLGPSIIQNGAEGYAGYNISWTWMSDSGTDGDPYEDQYAKCFWESANELWVALCDGQDFIGAAVQMRNKYDAWIDYWFNHASDPNAGECIKWLLHDRDGLVVLTKCMLYTNQTECENNDCYWYNNVCNSLEEQYTSSQNFSLIPLIPILAIVTVVLLVGYKKI